MGNLCTVCRKRRAEQAPINIDGTVVEWGESFKFRGVHITNELSWSKHTQDSHEEGKTTPFPPQETEKIWHGSPDPQKVIQLHHREHPDRLHHCLVWQLIGIWRKALQRVVYTAQYITEAELPAIQDLYTRRCQRKAQKSVKDSSHPNHRLFSLLPHGKRYRRSKSETKRLSFYPQAIRLLNNYSNGHYLQCLTKVFTPHGILPILLHYNL